MTTYREELGYIDVQPKPRPRPAVARVEGVREVDGEWEAEVLKADGRRCWHYGRTRDEAMSKAREYVRRANG